MTRMLRARRLAIAGTAAFAAAIAPATAGAASQTFTTPGEHQLTLPAGVTHVHVTAVGARGGTGAASSYVVNYYGYSPPLTDDFASALAPGGFGDVVDTDLALPSGTTKLFVEVGGRGADATDTTGPDSSTGGVGGVNGGGTGGGGQAGGGGGGGASDVRLCSVADATCDGGTLASRLLVAAGGGGGGALFQEPSNYQLLGGPGGGGREAGGNALATYYAPNNVVHGGAAGTQGAGGAGGAAAANEPFAGGGGTLGAGGDGTFGTGPTGGGGGGGGGYYGGGAGAGGGKGADLGFARYGSGAGGGGGSSWVSGLSGDELAAAIARATAAGGKVVVSWSDDATPPAVTVTAPPVPAGQNGFFGPADVPVQVQVSATDPSGVTALACSDEGTPVTVASESGTATRTGTITLSADGAHALTCTATDGAGNSGAASGSQNTATVKIDRTAPDVTCDAPAPVFELGATGRHVTATVADAASGPVETSASAPADTSAIGAQTVSITGADAAGNTTTVSCPYRVAYRFDGFFQPVDADAINDVNAGQAVPLKWRVLDAAGRPVTDLDVSRVRVTATSLPCDLGTTADLPQEQAAGASGVERHDDGAYGFAWKTPKGYAGSCKTLTLDLGDGVAHTAQFRFRK